MAYKNFTKIIIKKLLLFLSLVLFISFISFLLMDLSPIDPINAFGRSQGIGLSHEKKAQLIIKWGLDKPFFTRYILWLKNLFMGDLGISNIYERPVISVIREGFFSSAMLMLAAWTLQGIVGFILGVISGVKHNKLTDKIIKLYCIVVSSTPTFWVALLMIMLFAVKLGWFPIGFSAPIGVLEKDVTIIDRMYHMILPAITLAFVGIANIALHTREKVIDVMNSDYILFARVRGLKGFSLITKCGLKNVVLPAITLQFAYFSELFSGTILAENAFSYPGLGSIAVNAGLSGDVPLLLGITVFSAVFVFLGNQIADILHLIIDPRIRKGGKS